MAPLPPRSFASSARFRVGGGGGTPVSRARGRARGRDRGARVRYRPRFPAVPLAGPTARRPITEAAVKGARRLHYLNKAPGGQGKLLIMNGGICSLFILKINTRPSGTQAALSWSLSAAFPFRPGAPGPPPSPPPTYQAIPRRLVMSARGFFSSSSSSSLTQLILHKVM